MYSLVTYSNCELVRYYVYTHILQKTDNYFGTYTRKHDNPFKICAVHHGGVRLDKKYYIIKISQDFKVVVPNICKKMERWENKVAIVTGASSGIGAVIAQELVERGITVVGIARRKVKLEILKTKCANKKGKFYYVLGDVAKEEDIIKAFNWIKVNVGPVHILINNAGIGRMASVIDGNADHIKDIFDTNVFGLCVATREAIKEMQSNKIDGHIININSILGHRVVRGNVFGLYGASKHAVSSLTESLKHELSLIGSKIKISSISPGFVKTEFVDASFQKTTETKERENQIKDGFEGAPILLPKDISDAVVYALSTAPHVQIYELIIQPVGEAI